MIAHSYTKRKVHEHLAKPCDINNTHTLFLFTLEATVQFLVSIFVVCAFLLNSPTYTVHKSTSAFRNMDF